MTKECVCMCARVCVCVRERERERERECVLEMHFNTYRTIKRQKIPGFSRFHKIIYSKYIMLPFCFLSHIS